MSNFSFYSPIVEKGYGGHRSHHQSSSGCNSPTFYSPLSSHSNESLSGSSSSSTASSRTSLLSSPRSPGLPSSSLIGTSLLCQQQTLLTNQIQLRFLNPGDYDTVKQLCEEWFPVEYPEKWFEAITSDSNLFSLAAILDGNIIGLIVSELKHGKDLNREDRDILCESQLKFTVAYILSLGVVNSSRRQGIASLLLSSLLNHLSTLQCKAVFLHVLTSNEPALHFYEKHHFRVHKFLPYYYSIGGRAKDGFTYVLYLNGGHGPWGLQEYVQHICEVTMRELCSFPNWCILQVRRITHSILTMIR